MLTCKHIIKDYPSGDKVVHALRDVSLTFRDNEFVSILGPSGCGKTTFLNILGGLDHYTSGDLVINGKSTKEYSEKDWDTYRNHHVGFVFQSYNLIMHQTVLANVELALTLTGVEKKERKERAIQALEKVGLSDQIHKRPSQLSGGQMQRVAIARALINDPDIVLADEPTGALDSETSVQIMELLKEIAKNKLVIMVTHNPSLAQDYSTRIIRLFDGQVQSDSQPVDETEIHPHADDQRRPSMSFKTALALSMTNLMTKKARTLLTAFAGSIGIIGIALVLSLSNGMQLYIDRVENDTMSSYPIEIQDYSTDMSVMLSTMMNMQKTKTNKDGKIHTQPMVKDILDSVSSSKKNNLSAFKAYLESADGKAFQKATKAIEYEYDLPLQVYNEKTQSGLVQVSPNGLLQRLGMSEMLSATSQLSGNSSGQSVWMKLPDSQKLRDDEFELIGGKWASNENEVVLAVDQNNEISDYALYSLGLMNQDDLVNAYQDFIAGNTDKMPTTTMPTYTKDELLNTSFRLVLNTDLYQKRNAVWIDASQDENALKEIVAKSKEVKVVGIIRPKKSTANQQFYGGVYYTSAMQKYVAQQCEQSQIYQEQKSSPQTNVFTGQAFGTQQSRDISAMAGLSQSDMWAYAQTMSENANATYDANMKKLGYMDPDDPSSINLYVSSFDQKEKVSALITKYNEQQKKVGKTKNVITYNDVVGTMMKSVTSVIDLISYVLIGFVSVSLIVSSIMIGIITYISVLERTKEIGILRAMGASKRDISRVFNAETFIIGLTSGIMGIVITLLLNFPISSIVYSKTKIANIARLPWQGGLILILISLGLTVLAGLIPARIASKKDPVEALRSE
ncbi:MAG: ABC transporter ATP-binding protein/permease [Absicoccus sp.]|uniref:ABC transporter ATP-binding protein/permease n=1 Tax=Absicoccus sp. TaxID=2718527 RepID=UPI002A74FFD7|nr:ABC transporter ATP-binding protein/permease [Absicoccus sp.]MDY3036473.1 ABC transporter ATP-binding protein/permease [Absicoccus sp.]